MNPHEERDVLQQEEQCLDELILKNALTWLREVFCSLSGFPPPGTNRGLQKEIGGIWRLCLELLRRRSHLGCDFVTQILTVPSIVWCVYHRTHLSYVETEQLLAGSINAFGNLKEKFHLLSSSSCIEGCPSTIMLTANLSALCSNAIDSACSLPLSSTMKLPRCPMLSDALYLLSDIFATTDAVPECILEDKQASCLVIDSSPRFQTAVPIPFSIQTDIKGLLACRRVKYIVALQLFGLGQAVRALHQITAEEEQTTREVQKISAAAMALESVQKEKARRKNWGREGGLSYKVSKYLSDTMAKLLISNQPDGSAASKETVLDNTSRNAMAAARGLNGPYIPYSDNAVENAQQSVEEGPVDEDAVWALVHFLGRILWRWSVTFKRTEGTPSCVSDLKNVVCFSTDIVARLWAFYISTTTSTSRNSVHDVNIQRIHDRRSQWVLLGVICDLYAYMLVVLDDSELSEVGKPLPLHHIRRFISHVSSRLFRYHWEGVHDDDAAIFFATTAESVLHRLRDRDSRRALCPLDCWIIPNISDTSGKHFREMGAMTQRARAILDTMPQSIKLTARLRLFEELICRDRELNQGLRSTKPTMKLVIRRGHTVEDGLKSLDRLSGWQMKLRFQVTYISELGHVETGVDGGGLFKDFWTDLSAVVFNPDYGLFSTTEAGFLYPNPHSQTLHGPEHLKLFVFVGRVLGKAIYEGISIQPQLATFFLGYCRGKYDYLGLFHDLSGLDPELYNSLLFLKNYDKDAVKDLSLTFTVVEDNLGVMKEIELLPGGSTMAVTGKNRLEYVNRVAKYMLIDRLALQSKSFVNGVWEVLCPRRLQFFSEPELQVLISGSTLSLDLGDLQRHTKYGGGFTPYSTTVKKFWKVLGSMTPREHAMLLKFVTGCERPPPLGFESVCPPFTLQRIAIKSDENRLPSASTCFNTLKLPTYKSESVMKAKLLLAISTSGFELT